MSEPSNIFVHLLFVDPRSLEQVAAALSQALECTFARPDRDRPWDEERFEARTFGLEFSLQDSDPVPHGPVYRLTGVTRSRYHSAAQPQLSLNHHVKQMLRSQGIDQFLELEEYRRLRIPLPRRSHQSRDEQP